MAQKQEENIKKFAKANGVTTDQLSKTCENSDFNRLGQVIANVRLYQYELGLTEQQIQDINHKHQDSIRLQLIDSLKQWKSNCKAERQPATFYELLRVALRMQDGYGAEHICNACKSSSQNAESSNPAASSSAHLHQEVTGQSAQTATTPQLLKITRFCTMEQPEHLTNSPETATPQDLSHAVIVLKTRWDPGQIKKLKVHFLNPEFLIQEQWKCGDDPLTVSTILSWATFWNRPEQKYPEICADKVEKADDAHIRIEFRSSSKEWSRSAIGNEARNVIDLRKPTMILNLKGMELKLQRSMVIHEFGHALGLYHEHQRSDFWDVLESKDEESQYRFIIGRRKMEKGIGGCQKACPEHFRQSLPGQAEFSEYDSDSIMHYWFDINWLLPEYRNLSTCENLSEQEIKVLRGVHNRDWHNGSLAKDPSQSDYDTLNIAYSMPSTYAGGN